MKLTERALRAPVTTLMVFLCIVVIGAIASRLLPLELFPALDAPFVAVTVPYPGATPEEVETEITRPVEEVLATISDIKKMTSTSNEGGANVQIEFNWGVDTDVKAIEAKEKIEGIRSQLPTDVERLLIEKFNTADMAVLVIRISSERDLSNSYDLLNRNIKRRLERLKGVSRVTLYGIEKRQILIRLLADRLVAHGVDLNRLSRVLRDSNFLVTAGRINDGDRRFTVRPLGELASVEDVGALIIGDRGLRLRDVATIGFEQPELTYGRHLNRSYAIGLDVFKEAGANIVDVGNRAKAEIEAIRSDPRLAGIQIYIMDDAAEGIVISLDELLHSGLLGGLLAIVVLFVFLRQWTSTLIVALAVPVSLLATMAVMYFLGLSLNMLSMMGLMLAVGMLVDNSVVVTENILRFRKDEPDVRRATIGGVNDVALAITAGTATTVIVFLPNMVSADNQIAIFLKHVAISFGVALVTSLIIAQTVVPLLAARFARPMDRGRVLWIDRLVVRYQNVLSWLLHHRWASLGLLVLTLASVAIPAKFVKSNMFPPQEDRRLRLFYDVNDTYTVAKVEQAVRTVEDYLFANQQRFELESVYSYYEAGYAMSTVLLKKDEEATRAQEEIQKDIEKGLPEVAVGKVTFEHRHGGGGSNEALRVQLHGASTEQLRELSREVADTLNRIPGFKDARSEATVGRKEVRVRVDRERARLLGLNPQEIASSIAVAMRGSNLRRMHDENGEIEVRVEFQREDQRNLEQLRELTLFRGTGQQPVKLSSVADLVVRQGPNSIRRENRATTLGVTLDTEDLAVNEARKRIENVLGEFRFPPGVRWNFGESFDFERETNQAMMLNTLLALALIYFVMAALFESIFYPAAIWSSILFAVVGVWWFFLLTGTTFSLMAWIGVLILIGVVVNNGIVLIDHINQLRVGGLSRHDAIVRGGGDRLRPILITACTTILSLVPLCFSTVQIGGGGPPYFPMARAIAGGLAFATAVTLVLLPEVYVLLDDLRSWYWRTVKTAFG